MTISRILKTTVALPVLALLMLSGCGGGGSTSTIMPPPGQSEAERRAAAITMALAALTSAQGSAEQARNACAAVSTACGGATDAAAAVAVAQSAVMTTRDATATLATVEQAVRDAEMAAETAMTSAAHAQEIAGGSTTPVPTLADSFVNDLNREYVPSTATIKRDFVADATTLTDEFAVTSIRRTTAGGYRIAYRIGTDAGAAEILPEHCDPNIGCQVTNSPDGRTYWFWNFTPGSQLNVPNGYSYVNRGGFIVEERDTNLSNNYRTYWIFGVNTPAAAMPTRGEAFYTGWFRADAYRKGVTSSQFRQRYDGVMQLVANFDMSSLNGRIFHVRISQPGSNTRLPQPTSSFSIAGGQINNGQFTATLTGSDSDPTVPFVESVRGFMGQIVGRFFGPNADEYGGTVSADRDAPGTDDDLNLAGIVVGARHNPRLLGSAALMAGVRRDIPNNTTALIADDATAAVERTADGWAVTVGGRTFAFDDTDFSADSRFSTAFYVSDSDGDRYLWTYTSGLTRPTRYEHFDVKGWNLSIPNQNNANTADQAYLVHGNRTPETAIPASGTATYSGGFSAQEHPSDQAVSTRDAAVTYFWGSAVLTADFASSSVAGTFSDMRKRPGNSGTSTAANGGATFNAQINGSRLTASDLMGTGDLAGYRNGAVRGAFFGPAAEEAAGVFDAADGSANRVLSGYFGTKKD